MSGPKPFLDADQEELLMNLEASTHLKDHVEQAPEVVKKHAIKFRGFLEKNPYVFGSILIVAGLVLSFFGNALVIQLFHAGIILGVGMFL